ncbi:unnamed protein product [Gongylonema pulchrum]|uniref:Uncharacterized protein n=1 Tax=Gongylonema pulchrum TaxID=637853 RepID=A0A183DA91_9BILA|nr:unnamed protein product [Gongylonema pulchrum]
MVARVSCRDLHVIRNVLTCSLKRLNKSLEKSALSKSTSLLTQKEKVGEEGVKFPYFRKEINLTWKQSVVSVTVHSFARPFDPELHFPLFLL